MDIIELLILAAFIVLPLLQALLEKIAGKGRKELPPDDGVAGERREAREGARRAPVATQEARSERSAGATEAASEEGWSAGWGRWESESLEELAAEEVVTQAEAEEIIERQDGLENELATTEAARVTVPVVSMERLHVDRRGRESGAAASRQMPRPPAVAAAERRRIRRILPGLSTPAEVKRAIVLAEVLGPPRALQASERLPGS